MNRVVVAEIRYDILAAGITEQERISERRALKRIVALARLNGDVLPGVGDVIFARRARHLDTVLIIVDIIDIIKSERRAGSLEPVIGAALQCDLADGCLVRFPDRHDRIRADRLNRAYRSACADQSIILVEVENNIVA